MKSLTTLAFGMTFALLPLLASAQTTTLPVPSHLSPADNAALTTTSFTSADWNDALFGTSSLSYNYEVSNVSSTTADGSFITPLFISSLLASSTISTVGTAEGIYFWHVRSLDSIGNKSAWSAPWKVTVDNTVPTTPGVPTLTSNISPVVSTSTSGTSTVTVTTISNGTQVWSFTTATDTLSGIASYEYSLNGSSTWINNALSTTITTNFGIGTHTLSVRATDRSGNKSLISIGQVVVSASSTVPTIPTQGTLIDKKQCKKNGWKTFTNPTFKNQGACISYAEKIEKKLKKERKEREDRDKRNREEDDSRDDDRRNNSGTSTSKISNSTIRAFLLGNPTFQAFLQSQVQAATIVNGAKESNNTSGKNQNKKDKNNSKEERD